LASKIEIIKKEKLNYFGNFLFELVTLY